MNATCELLVIGAGPAGMAAAQTAANHGVDVMLVDEQANPGGQIYRNVDSDSALDAALLGKDYTFGRTMVRAFRHAHLDYRAKTGVWYLDQGSQAGLLHEGRSQLVNASYIVIASGAQERPVPIPNWQLPGVMTAGAGQILLKSAAVVPEDGVVLAGSGPLLLLLAWQYLQAGVRIRALLDTTPATNRWRALSRLPRALAAADYLFKGLRLVGAIRRARVPWLRGVRELTAEGGERIDAVSFSLGGRRERIETNLLLLHQGIIPSLHLSQAAGCEIDWNDAQQCLQPRVDRWAQSSRENCFVVGDAARIVGARAAGLDGQIAGLQVACRLGRLQRSERDRLARPLRHARERHLAIRPFLDAAYRVPGDVLLPRGDTLVCRCEEVSAAELERIIELGCSGPNQAKAFTRCGMGPCQGRWCAASVAQMFTQLGGVATGDVAGFRARPPLAPITLGQLAQANHDSAENEHD